MSEHLSFSLRTGETAYPAKGVTIMVEFLVRAWKPVCLNGDICGMCRNYWKFLAQAGEIPGFRELHNTFYGKRHVTITDEIYGSLVYVLFPQEIYLLSKLGRENDIAKAQPRATKLAERANDNLVFSYASILAVQRIQAIRLIHDCVFIVPLDRIMLEEAIELSRHVGDPGFLGKRGGEVLYL